jgi:hypothetical protein
VTEWLLDGQVEIFPVEMVDQVMLRKFVNFEGSGLVGCYFKGLSPPPPPP